MEFTKNALSNLRQHDAKQLVLQDPFVKEVIDYWTIINYRDENLDFESAYIWYNSLITIEHKPFFYKSWFNAGRTEGRRSPQEGRQFHFL